MNKICTKFKSRRLKKKYCPLEDCNGCSYFKEEDQELTKKKKARAKKSEKIWDGVFSALFYIVFYGSYPFVTVFSLKEYIPEDASMVYLIGFAVYFSMMMMMIAVVRDRLDSRIEKLEKKIKGLEA